MIYSLLSMCFVSVSATYILVLCGVSYTCINIPYCVYMWDQLGYTTPQLSVVNDTD